jgi:hypothetical protein
MAAFDDYLQGNDPTTVDPLTVTAVKKPVQDDGLQLQPPVQANLDLLPGVQPVDRGADQTGQMPSVDYNNSISAGAVNDSLEGEPPLRGGMANPGLYGLLPQGLQHGTLRNMLGALGDAFLVGSGHQAQYEPRMQRQEIGRAMAGYNPDDPQATQAAIQRIASTGAVGSTEMADQLQKNYNDVQLRKQLMQQNQNYKQQTIQARNDNLFNRMNPVAQADLAQATSAEDYAARLARWNTRLKAIDPTADAVSAFGVPDQYSPGGVSATAGMTAQQLTQHGDRMSQQGTSRRDADVRAAATIGAARISAGSRDRATDVGASKPTGANILQGLIDKQNRGENLTPAEQATFDHMTNIGKRGRSLPPGLTVGGPGGLQTLTPAQAHALAAKGGHGQFRGTDGKVYSY